MVLLFFLLDKFNYLQVYMKQMLSLVDWYSIFLDTCNYINIFITFVYSYRKKLLSFHSTFKWKYFVQGFIGGTLTLAGANFIVAALMVEGAPCGPTVALINCQIIFLVILDALI